MGDDEEHRPVDNPQRSWLVNRRSQVAHSLSVLTTHFDPGTTALGAGAWKGKAGAAWEQEFSGRVTQVRTVGQTITEDFDTTIALMPTTVCSCQVGMMTLGPYDYFGSYPSIAPSCSK